MTPVQQVEKGYNKEMLKINDMKGDKEVSIRAILKDKDLTPNQKQQQIRDIEMSCAQKLAKTDPGSVPLWYRRKFGKIV